MNYKKLLLVISVAITPLAHATIIDIESEANLTSLMADNGSPIVIKFAANWCGTCQAIKDSFEKIANDPKFGYITFYHVNIDKLPELTKKYSIIGIPTFVFINNLKEFQRENGVKNVDLFYRDFSKKLMDIFPKR